jgi:hypothetical protein
MTLCYTPRMLILEHTHCQRELKRHPGPHQRAYSPLFVILARPDETVHPHAKRSVPFRQTSLTFQT